MEPSLQLVCLGDNLLLYSPGWPRTQSPPASAGMTGLCCHAWLSSLLFRVTVLDMPESVCLTGARRAQHLALGVVGTRWWLWAVRVNSKTSWGLLGGHTYTLLAQAV